VASDTPRRTAVRDFPLSITWTRNSPRSRSSGAGGGGIGYILKPRVDLGEWGEVGTLVLLIAGTVWLMDIISAKIRERIV